MNLYIDRDIFDFVMYYIYGQSGPSLLIESTDSMILNPAAAESVRWFQHHSTMVVYGLYACGMVVQFCVYIVHGHACRHNNNS